LKNNQILKHVKGKSILVTGGTGSIGSAIVKGLLDYSPKVVRVIDVSENQLFFLQEQLKDYDNVRFLVGDIREKERMHRAAEDVDIIFHTAALKHVPLCEENPFEAAKTNVIGTQNVIDIAIENNVSQLVHISTDKVVNAINTLGASKLLSERLVIAAHNYIGHKKTSFCCVRFGNVIGTKGSLVHLISEQLHHNERPFITDKKMTRFLLTENDAANFILKASAMKQDGAIFVPKMPAVNVIDLIQATIDELCSRYSLKQTTPKETEIRTGEKLYEELMTELEFERCKELDGMYIIPSNLSSSKAIPKKKISLRSDKAEKIPYDKVRKMISEVIDDNKKLFHHSK
jgi:UDP-N-acetylglucosamine 4,6-dehydratase